MKTKIILLLALTFAIFYRVSAQETALPENLSLKEAQQIALKNNPDMQVKQINTAISKKQVEQARWKKIPDIYVNYDLQRNLIIPTTPVPTKAFDPNAPEGELMPLKFSTNWTSNAGLNARFDLFNPQTHGQVKEAEQQAAISETDEKITENNLRFTVGKDYGACIIAKEQLKLAIADTISKNKVLKMTQDQYDAGRLKITDLNQIEADKNEAISSYLKAINILASAKAQLLADMGFDPSKTYSFLFTDSIQNLLSGYKKQPNKRESSLSLQKREQQKTLTNIQLQNARAGFLPTVSLNGFYGANYYDNDFNLFKNKNWYGNSYISVSLNIPITEGLDRVKKIDILRLQSEADQADYRNQQNQIQLEKTEAQQDIAYKEKDLLHKKKSMELAKQNLQTATQQFSNGRLLVGDLAKSNFLYQQAKTAYLQAAYEFIVAKMNLEKVNRE